MTEFVGDDVARDVRQRKRRNVGAAQADEPAALRPADGERNKIGSRKCYDNIARNLPEPLWDVRYKPAAAANYRCTQLTKSFIPYGLNQPSDRTQSKVNSRLRKLLVPEFNSLLHGTPAWIAIVGA